MKMLKHPGPWVEVPDFRALGSAGLAAMVIAQLRGMEAAPLPDVPVMRLNLASARLGPLRCRWAVHSPSGEEDDWLCYYNGDEELAHVHARAWVLQNRQR